MKPIVVLALALCCAASVAGQRHVTLTDDQIKAQVDHKLFDAGLVGITVGVREGNVTLTGTVPSLWSKDAAVKETRKVSDVKEVTSTLTVTRAESDADVAAAIGDALRGSVFFTVFDDVNGVVADGVATLTGSVTTPYKSQGILQAVSRVEGVQEIVNRIEVLPASGFDDEIRYAVAARIYNNAAFTQYAIQSKPSVHIIVKNGHVTLTGMVNSEMDRRLAQMLAHEVFGVLGVDNALRIER
jgi:osmotically-inducible protein OsmY